MDLSLCRVWSLGDDHVSDEVKEGSGVAFYVRRVMYYWMKYIEACSENIT